jgi:hypothetical protein
MKKSKKYKPKKKVTLTTSPLLPYWEKYDAANYHHAWSAKVPCLGVVIQ